MVATRTTRTTTSATRTEPPRSPQPTRKNSFATKVRANLKCWEELDNPWVTSVIKEGVKVYFKPKEAKSVYSKLTPNLCVRNSGYQEKLTEQVADLLESGVISVLDKSCYIYPSYIFSILQNDKYRLIWVNPLITVRFMVLKTI